MDLSLIQINFMFLYKYCQESHIDVSAYDYVDLNEIGGDDVKILLNYILYKYNISSSFEQFELINDIEDIVHSGSIDNLNIGVNYSKQLELIKKHVSNINDIYNYVSDRFFVEKIEQLLLDISVTLPKLFDFIRNKNIEFLHSSDVDVPEINTIDFLFN